LVELIVSKFSPSPVNVNNALGTILLNPGATGTLQSVKGRGSVNVIFQGNGDGNFNLQASVDGGPPQDVHATNLPAIAAYAFSKGVAISVVNPTTGTLLATTDDFSIQGLASAS
jgi:hypothetical protein